MPKVKRAFAGSKSTTPPPNLTLPHGVKQLVRFDIPLEFDEEDSDAFPWLKDGDRYYFMNEKLGGGGFSDAYKGWACHASGARLMTSRDLVLKIPSIDERKSTTDIDIRITGIQRNSREEWALVRKRLMGCKYANPIFDMGTVWATELKPIVQFTVTAQLFLDNALELNKWLVHKDYRAKLSTDAAGRPINDWKGISNWRDWLQTATMIADGLSDIHRRRVIHGDIWPPNIYITKTEPHHVIFIDFGESFTSTPTGEPRNQPDHPYRAPERDKSEYVPTEQVDVYSFGKLLLYLTLGEEKKIPRPDDGTLLVGHYRRAFVRDCLLAAGSHLVREHPEILDIIAQCTAWDPVDRPDMVEIQTQLVRLESRLGTITSNSA